MPNDHSLLDAPRVLKPASLKALRGEPLSVQNVVDRWASGSPKKVRELEASGKLLERAKEQAALERQIVSDARVGGRMYPVSPLWTENAPRSAQFSTRAPTPITSTSQYLLGVTS